MIETIDRQTPRCELFLGCNDHIFSVIPPTPSLAVSFPSFLPLLTTGDALLTVATGSISDAQAEREGLVDTCVYAVLNVVEIKVKREV